MPRRKGLVGVPCLEGVKSVGAVLDEGALPHPDYAFRHWHQVSGLHPQSTQIWLAFGLLIDIAVPLRSPPGRPC